MNNINRKTFLQKTTKSGIAICLGVGLSMMLQSCKTVKRVQAPLLNDVIRIDQKFLDKAGEILIENEALPAPLYLALIEGKYTALLLLCTHKECEVNPTGEVFTCPCHGSQFEKNGERISGPAEKSLKAFKTEQSEGQIIIYLSKVIEQ
jgi:cytochrome b6-f complex iron-sulfur subunit